MQRLAIASTLLLALACNNPVTHTPSISKASAIAGSCLLKVKATGKPSSCGEYADARTGQSICDAVAEKITALSVTWSPSPCPTIGALARCAIPADAKAGLPASVDSYYAPAFAEDSGQGACAESGGQWTKTQATALKN